MSAQDVIGSFDDNTKVSNAYITAAELLADREHDFSHLNCHHLPMPAFHRRQRELAAFLEAEQGKARIQSSVNDFLARCSETCQVKLDGSSLRR